MGDDAVQRFGRILVASALAGSTVESAFAQERSPAPVGDVTDWFSGDNYPPQALRLAQEGRVVTVDATGRPTGCRVRSTSGSPSLDAGTCDIAMTKAFFTPARNGRGRPIASEYVLPVRWVVPKEAGLNQTIDVASGFAMPPKFTIETRVTVNPDGTVAACAADRSNAELGAAGGPCSAYPVGKKVMPAMTRNGRPVGAQIVTRFKEETTFDK